MHEGQCSGCTHCRCVRLSCSGKDLRPLFDACTGSAEIAEPAFAARSGFAASLLYWLTVHVYGSLTPLEGKALITTLFIAHGLLVDIFGWHFDFTMPPAYVAHTLANVPMPGLPTRPAAAAHAPKAAASTATSSKRGADSRVLENKKAR